MTPRQGKEASALILLFLATGIAALNLLYPNWLFQKFVTLHFYLSVQ